MQNIHQVTIVSPTLAEVLFCGTHVLGAHAIDDFGCSITIVRPILSSRHLTLSEVDLNAHGVVQADDSPTIDIFPSGSPSDSGLADFSGSSDLNTNGAIEGDDTPPLGITFSGTPSDILEVPDSSDLDAPPLGITLSGSPPDSDVTDSGSTDLNAKGAIQADDIPLISEIISGDPSNFDTIEAREVESVSGTEISVAFNVGNDADLSTVAANLNHMAQTQSCQVFKCLTIIPKILCVTKAIASGGSWNTIWNRIKDCGITSEQV
jgi:hypothetical protein